MDELDWSDLRYVLALGRQGSLAGAAAHLKVNATTVQRRLDALERRLGARLFDRLRSGYRATEAGAARNSARRCTKVRAAAVGANSIAQSSAESPPPKIARRCCR
jgi:DNA-binding transcriptional LysR family regulator